MEVRVVGWTLLALALGWLAFVVWLVIARPEPDSLRQAARLVPDTARLIRRLATDRTIPRSTRLPVWLVIGYLAMPIDLVPDFLPVIGYADDVVLISLALRRIIRRSGADKLTEHWPGTPDGLDMLRRLVGVN